MTALALHGITKSFGATAVLRGVDLTVADGEFVAIVGPSGCGKSTLLRIVAGLETHYGGAVRIRGEAVDALPPGRRDVAMVFQSYALYPQMTVEQNIALPLVMRRLTRFERLPVVRSAGPAIKAKRAAISAAVRRAASMVSLDGLLDRKPRELSGGQRQRVALARALVREPRLFLLDEPLSNLDASLRGTTRAEIVDLQRRLGIATVFVTHDQTEAMTMADRIVVLMEGAAVQIGTARDLYEAPADLRVACFIGSPPMNLLPGTISGGIVRIDGSDAPVASTEAGAEGPATIGIRAEHLTVGDPARAQLAGSVRRTEYLGAERLVHVTVEAGPGHRDVIVSAGRNAPSITAGAALGLGFAPTDIHVFDRDGRRLATTAPDVAASSALRLAEAAR